MQQQLWEILQKDVCLIGWNYPLWQSHLPLYRSRQITNRWRGFCCGTEETRAFPVSSLSRSHWHVSLLQDLLSLSANSAITSLPPLLCLAGKLQTGSLAQSASRSAVVLANILSAEVPADRTHKAILGNLKPMSTIFLYHQQFGASESCS